MHTEHLPRGDPFALLISSLECIDNVRFGSKADIRSQHVVRPSLICGQLFLRVEEQDPHFLDR